MSERATVTATATLTTSGEAGPTPVLVEHFFRHEYGRLVAILVRQFGLSRLELIEDSAQTALLAALTEWMKKGVPTDAHAWVYRVARNQTLATIRNEGRREDILSATVTDEQSEENCTLFLGGEVRDELLRMLFVCCDESLSRDSQVALALKTLCGFSVSEIAFRLFTTEANIYKRLARARERLREVSVETDTPPTDALRSRLSSVHSVLYLLFNEGYLSTHAERTIRVELCEEAIRLATLLAGHPVGAVPTTFALLALMHLHAARLAARQDATGGLLLLEEQDRDAWDRSHLEQGSSWLAQSAQGEEFTRFHAEAGIAAEHCFAPSFAETRWSEIADFYAMLERIEPSPIYTLNRAIAIAQYRGAETALTLLAQAARATWLTEHYLWDAVLADLHGRAGHHSQAEKHRSLALHKAPSEAIRTLLDRRLRWTT